MQRLTGSAPQSLDDLKNLDLEEARYEDEAEEEARCEDESEDYSSSDDDL